MLDDILDDDDIDNMLPARKMPKMTSTDTNPVCYKQSSSCEFFQDLWCQYGNPKWGEGSSLF